MAIYDVNGLIIPTGGGGGGGTEEVARERLSGKILIALGDSYTAGMRSQLSALASRYNMIIDNRGVVSATISYRNTTPNKRMFNIADTIVTDYTSGKTIDGTTYYTDDVAIITFMGGANDGSIISSWIGTGIQETDKTTIYGSLNHIFNVFRETFTKSEIICITQPSNYAILKSSVSTDAGAQELGFTDLAELQVMSDVQFSNYCHAIKEEAVKAITWPYGVKVVDMYYEFPSILNPSNRANYWQNDKLHLTTAGYNLIANALNYKIIELFGQT